MRAQIFVLPRLPALLLQPSRLSVVIKDGHGRRIAREMDWQSINGFSVNVTQHNNEIERKTSHKTKDNNHIIT